MCEECEEIEPLTVAYFGKPDRKGWRPPAAARSEPLNSDRELEERIVSGRPYAISAPRFVCVPEGPRETD